MMVFRNDGRTPTCGGSQPWDTGPERRFVMRTQCTASAGQVRRHFPLIRRLGRPGAIALALLVALLVAEFALIALVGRFVYPSGPIFTT